MGVPKTIKVFADGAKIEDFKKLNALPYISGFTTNPSLMKKAGVKNYLEFVETVLSIVKYKPVSFEVIADDFPTMKEQALKLSECGDNVYVKIPITNSKGESSLPLIRELLDEKVIGAGGGGFLLLYCSDDKSRLISALKKINLKPTWFSFEHTGVKTIFNQ